MQGKSNNPEFYEMVVFLSFLYIYDLTDKTFFRFAERLGK